MILGVKITGAKNKKAKILDLGFLLVTLRGPSAKHFWDGIEKFGEHLEELGVGD